MRPALHSLNRSPCPLKFPSDAIVSGLFGAWLVLVQQTTGMRHLQLGNLIGDGADERARVVYPVDTQAIVVDMRTDSRWYAALPDISGSCKGSSTRTIRIACGQGAF